MNPPIGTDYRRFFCVGARRALPYPLHALWLRVSPRAEQRSAPTAQAKGPQTPR